MEFLKEYLQCEDLLHCLLQLIRPETIITIGGVYLLLGVIFAETGLFLGFFLPGDSLLFVAGIICHKGNILDGNVLLLCIVVSIAAILGNMTGYLFGRKVGAGLFKREDSFFFKRKHLEMTKAFYEKHGRMAIILGRFLPIIRTFVPIFAGVINLDLKKFFLYTVIGGIAWVFSMILVGFFLGEIFPGIEKYIDIIVLVLILVSTLPVIITILKQRTGKKS